MNARVRVLLADDHAMVREGLALLVAGEKDMEVVAQAGDGAEAVRLARDTAPDIVVLEVALPGLASAEVTERIREQCPATRVLALSRHADQASVRRLLQAGAAGYVVTRSAAHTLLNAIRVVAQGGTYVEPELAGSMLQRAFGGARGPGDSLSEREEEVLRAIAWGRSNKEIAAELGLSIKTVESYKAGAVEKLRLHSRADIVRYALARGWLTEDNAPE